MLLFHDSVNNRKSFNLSKDETSTQVVNKVNLKLGHKIVIKSSILMTSN